METKPGPKTTEFWVTLFTGGLMLVDITGVSNFVPDKYATIGAAIIGGAYAVSRGLAKQGVMPSNSGV